MDDRTWYLAIGTLAAGVLAYLLDAVLVSFNVDSGIWVFLSASFAFLGGRSAFRSRNGKDK